MPVSVVQDYLQTQGLDLPQDEIKMAHLAAQTVMQVGRASIDRQVLWYTNEEVELARYIACNEENEACLRRMFMALDSTFDRAGGQSAVVYLYMPDDEAPYLLRLVQQGAVVEQRLPVDEEQSWYHLASRTAKTGWLNLADDVDRWLAYEELKGGHHARCGSQMSLPVCSGNGKVLGVLHVECAAKHGFDQATQVEWVALALALIEPMQTLLGLSDEREEGENV